MATAKNAAQSSKSSTPEQNKAQAVATNGPSAVLDPRQANVPDYIKKGQGRGSENVEMTDLVIPRIEIAQALSPVLKKNDPNYIEGCEQGDLYNSVTFERYGPNIVVVPVFFKKQYLCWRHRDDGGGFAGAFDNLEDANARIEEEHAKRRAEGKSEERWEAIETAQQLVLVVRKDGGIDEAVVSMAKTKLKVSRQWNSLIRMNGNDRFSRTYALFAVDEQNAKGDDYKNFAVANGGFPSEAVYRRAEALYAAMASGSRKMNVDSSDVGEGEAGGGTKEY